MKWLIIYVVLIIVTISVGCFITYKTWIVGGTNKDYHIICINGHEYYRANFAHKGFLGIHLNDDGTPIKCTIKEE